MPALHVCSLERVPSTAAVTAPSHVLSLLSGISPFPATPSGVAPDNHLKMLVGDITAPLEGHVLPTEDHVAEILEFGRRWDRDTERRQPMLIHCFAGISRSTASAFMIACALDPDRDEIELAEEIRALSPPATPNALFVHHADAMLGRQGRMVRAIQRIGRGRDAFTGVPFSIGLKK